MQIKSNIKVYTNDMNFALMKIKVGQVVKNQVSKSGIPKVRIAQKIDISRTWLNQILEDEYMEQEYIIKIGKCIQYDFSVDFPQISSEFFNTNFGYNIENTTDCQKKLLEVTEKYVILLEKYNLLLEGKTT